MASATITTSRNNAFYIPFLSMLELSQHLANISATVTALMKGQERIERIVRSSNFNVSARLNNRAVTHGNSLLEPVIRDTDCTWPEDFPKTYNDLQSLSADEVDEMLDFYGIEAVGNASARHRRLSAHIGVLDKMG
ncbi:hypothetical protein RUND412_003484 [Rhizina undulata]